MMQSFSRRGLLAGLALAASTGTVAASAWAQEVFIERGPPPPRHEMIPVLPPERAEREVWHPGAWHWNGREYVWEAGHYVVRPRHGAVWVPGHWDHRPRGWMYVQGHWG